MNISDFPSLKNIHHGTNINIFCSPFSIGRALCCDFVIPNVAISRSHCILEKIDNIWRLKDMSTNGTLINSTVYRGISSEPLKNGDQIALTVGNFTYEFCNSFKGNSTSVSGFLCDDILTGFNSNTVPETSIEINRLDERNDERKTVELDKIGLEKIETSKIVSQEDCTLDSLSSAVILSELYESNSQKSHTQDRSVKDNTIQKTDKHDEKPGSSKTENNGKQFKKERQGNENSYNKKCERSSLKPEKIEVNANIDSQKLSSSDSLSLLIEVCNKNIAQSSKQGKSKPKPLNNKKPAVQSSKYGKSQTVLKSNPKVVTIRPPSKRIKIKKESQHESDRLKSRFTNITVKLEKEEKKYVVPEQSKQILSNAKPQNPVRKVATRKRNCR